MDLSTQKSGTQKHTYTHYGFFNCLLHEMVPLINQYTRVINDFVLNWGKLIDVFVKTSFLGDTKSIHELQKIIKVPPTL